MVLSLWSDVNNRDNSTKHIGAKFRTLQCFIFHIFIYSHNSSKISTLIVLLLGFQSGSFYEPSNHPPLANSFVMYIHIYTRNVEFPHLKRSKSTPLNRMNEKYIKSTNYLTYLLIDHKKKPTMVYNTLNQFRTNKDKQIMINTIY